jgi:hypothetical protein
MPSPQRFWHPQKQLGCQELRSHANSPFCQAVPDKSPGALGDRSADRGQASSSLQSGYLFNANVWRRTRLAVLVRPTHNRSVSISAQLILAQSCTTSDSGPKGGLSLLSRTALDDTRRRHAVSQRVRQLTPAPGVNGFSKSDYCRQFHCRHFVGITELKKVLNQIPHRPARAILDVIRADSAPSPLL